MKIARFISQITSYNSLKCTKNRSCCGYGCFFSNFFQNPFWGVENDSNCINNTSFNQEEAGKHRQPRRPP